MEEQIKYSLRELAKAIEAQGETSLNLVLIEAADIIENQSQKLIELQAQVEQLKAMLKQQASIVVKYNYPLPDKDCTYSRAKDALDYCEKLPAQCLAARDAEVKVLAFEQAGIPKKAKAGCIGEFKFTIEGARGCPECYDKGPSNDCEMCGGESGENGVSDLTVSVPWDLCKEIWLTMNQFAANELRQQAKPDPQ